MKRKIVLSLICSCLIIILTGCGKSSENAIKKLNVDLEKYDLPCESGDVCNEIKNNIVQISSYEGKIDGNYYTEIILTSDGYIYLYSKTSSTLVKINGKTDLTHIDGTLQATYDYSNPLIYSDKKYYSIEDGTVSTMNFGFETKNSDVISYGYDSSMLLTDGSLLLYASCKGKMNKYSSDVCPTEESWVKYTVDPNTYLSWKVRYADPVSVVLTDGRLYSSAVLMSSWEYSGSTFKGYIREDALADHLILSDVRDIWYWDDEGAEYGQTLVQTSDNKLHFHDGDFAFDKKFESTIDFNEEVEKVIFSGNDSYFIIVSKSKVFLVQSDFNGSFNLIELEGLNKYKNEVRSMYMRSGDVYVLLSDGNMYKAYET